MIHQQYLRRDYRGAMDGAVAAWRGLDRPDGADEVELVDIIMRCSRKLGGTIADAAVEGARRWPVLVSTPVSLRELPPGRPPSSPHS